MAGSFCSPVDDDDSMTLFIGYEDDNESERGDFCNRGVRANKLLQLCKSYHICPISTYLKWTIGIIHEIIDRTMDKIPEIIIDIHIVQGSAYEQPLRFTNKSFFGNLIAII